jgi:hypothetical protein
MNTRQLENKNGSARPTYRLDFAQPLFEPFAKNQLSDNLDPERHGRSGT